MTDNLSIITDLITQAKKLGADDADAVMIESADISVSYRMGEQESLERAESRGVGLRVIVGKRQAIVSSTDTGSKALRELAERGMATAKIAPEDPYLTLADKNIMANDAVVLDLCDTQGEPSVEWLAGHAKEAEQVALAVKGITNSQGADASYSSHTIALATSKGFARHYNSSSNSLSVCVLAGEGTGMERDYDYTVARHQSDLEAPGKIGKTAAEKALRRLNPRKIPTGKVPVVFDPDVAKSLVGVFISAINGAAIARNTSFLKDKMGKQIFADGITIVDDPHRVRGLASKPFDAEGVAGKKRALIDNGMLTTWLLDLRSAKQLGLQPTGHASRGISSVPSPSASNVYMENGMVSIKELIRDIKSGFYVTNVFGMGVNAITGDYSQGAAGLWIENGEITYPANEITIASNLTEMFRHCTPANDLAFRHAVNAPTLRIESMMVAGAK